MVGPGANREIAERMLRSVAHRGPDGSGIYQAGEVIIGQTRLSIIDLVTGDQPMSNEDKSIWVVYNGETYNFPELRKELEAKGHHFRTTSDTEVIIHGYEEYGLDFLPRLDGIFAFALWDISRQRLLIVRDYFGIKPLHYYFDGRTLRFASEIKAILQDFSVPRQVDYQALHYFLNLRYIPGERTLFENIHRLLPGHFMLFENGSIRTERYYSLEFKPDPNHDESYYMEGIRHYLGEAVRKQLISDVPVGVYLSGGLDSSSIVAFTCQHTNEPVRTFTLGFNEPTDELEDARVIAEHFGTDHHETLLNLNPLKEYPRVIWHVEEPKENVLQGYMLAQFTRPFVKVVLGGLGGDELFQGYNIMQYLRPSQPFHRLVPDFIQHNLQQPLSRFVFNIENAMGRLELDEYRRGCQMLLSIGDIERYYLILRNVWDWDKGMFDNIYGPVLQSQKLSPTYKCFKPYFQSSIGGALAQAQWAEFNTKMVDDFLMNDDRTSMAHGLEVRVPFLDRDLVRFALSIPVDLKIKGNETKYLFRKAMADILPQRTIKKKKWGFTFNTYYQFQKDLKIVAERVLTRHRVEERGWFNYPYIRSILDHKPDPRMRWHYNYLWITLGLEIWAQMFLEGDLGNPSFNLESYYD